VRRPHRRSRWRATVEWFRDGHVSSVATRPEARRRGHARAVVGLLLTWFDEHGVPQQDLSSSREAEELYLALGFDDHPQRYLRRCIAG
jgi:GNAT superfamily N-acetyltransferase